MQRHVEVPREGWEGIVESQGLDFHTIGGERYWNEFASYSFTAKEIDEIEIATQTINDMTLELVDKVIREDLFSLLMIPEWCKQRIIASWDLDEPTIYGRYDFCHRTGEAPKLLEYNADTPTALLEASVIQWFWLQTQKPWMDQFNSIHEKLIERWKRWPSPQNPLYFSCVADNSEDFGTVNYLRDTAMQAGLDTEFIYIEDIFWNDQSRLFTDSDNRAISTLFKLYPWEWMVNEEFGRYIPECKTLFVEPAWKMILSNKGILPLLWEMYPNHPNLLPAYFSPSKLGQNYIQKPLLSREGANITIHKNGNTVATDGDYGEEGYIYQALHELPCFDGNYPVVGSWVIEGEAAGIGIREDRSLITTNLSRFVPHYFIPA